MGYVILPVDSMGLSHLDQPQKCPGVTLITCNHMSLYGHTTGHTRAYDHVMTSGMTSRGLGQQLW